MMGESRSSVLEIQSKAGSSQHLQFIPRWSLACGLDMEGFFGNTSQAVHKQLNRTHSPLNNSVAYEPDIAASNSILLLSISLQCKS